MIDLGPPPLVFPKPAIIRPAPAELLRYGSDPVAAMLPGMVMPIAAGAPALAWETTAYGSSDSELTTHDLGTVSIGAASVDRLVICLISGETSVTGRTVASAAMGGTNGSIVVEANSPIATAIVARLITTGTTMTLTVTFDNAIRGCRARVVTLKNYLSATAADFGSNTATSGTSVSATLDVPAGGVAFAVHGHRNLNAGTWSGESDVIAAAEAMNFGSGKAHWIQQAYRESASLLTDHVMSVSWSGSVSNSISAASWA